MTPFLLSSGILFLTLTNICLIVLHGLNTALMFTPLIDRHTLAILSDKPLTYGTHRVLFSLLSSAFSFVLGLVWLAMSTLLRMGSSTFCGKLLDRKVSSRCLISCRYSVSQMLTAQFLGHFTSPARTLGW